MSKLIVTASGVRYSTRDFDHPDDHEYLEQIRGQITQYLQNFKFTRVMVTIEVAPDDPLVPHPPERGRGLQS